MPRSKHKRYDPPPKYSYNVFTDHCDSFFDRPSDDWNYEAFVSHFASVGNFKFDILNHRWAKTLGAIEASPTNTRDRRRKARSLLDRLKNHSNQRRAGPNGSVNSAAPLTVIHGNLIHRGDIIQDGGVKIGNVTGNVITGEVGSIGKTVHKSTAHSAAAAAGPSAAGPSKRQIRSRTVEDALSEYGNDETDNDDSVTVDVPPLHESTPSPRYSPTPPYDEDPYSGFGEFPYSPEFVDTYLSMTPASKRRFETGKILEDTIFHNVRPTPANSKWLQGNPILRWILDLDDLEVKKWFTKAEKAQIISWGAPLPQRDPAFEYVVARFPKIPKSFEELWKITELKSHPDDESFDEARHSTAMYGNNAANFIIANIKSYSTCSWLGPPALHEGWFSGIWHPLIDRCLYCIPSFSILRTDVKSSCSNSKLRFDGIFRAQLADGLVHELGCIEVARVTAAIPAKKADVDADKLVGGLYDMLVDLGRTVRHDQEVMKTLQVVGIQNVGFKISMWTMQMVNRNVAVLHRGEGRCVPLELRDFGNVIDIMRAVVRAKGIFERSIESVRRWEERRKVSLKDVL